MFEASLTIFFLHDSPNKDTPYRYVRMDERKLRGLNPAHRTPGNYGMLRDGEFLFFSKMCTPVDYPMPSGQTWKHSHEEHNSNRDSLILRNIYVCINPCILTNTHIYVTAVNKKDAMNCEKNKWEIHGKALKGKKGRGKLRDYLIISKMFIKSTTKIK